MNFFKFSLLLSVFLSIGLVGYGQNNYYKIGDKVWDQEAYEVNKNTNESLAEKARMELFVEKKELYRNEDSIIYDINYHWTKNAQKTAEEIAWKNSLIGTVFPISDAETLDGQTVSIDKYLGKPTMVNLWFTACAPCIMEMPELNKLKKSHGDKINFVAVTFDKANKVEKLLKKHPFNFEQIVGAKDLTTKFGFKAFPVNVFLDKEGKIVAIEGGIPMDLDENGELVIKEDHDFVDKLNALL
jgi:thiol-disulfide isomerase/thioredoxin